MKRSFLIFSFLFFLILEVATQVEFTGELRTRAEFRNGYKTLIDSSSSPAYIVAQRSRLNAGFEQEKLDVFISLQDVRTWGEQKNKDDIASVALHEAWAEYEINTNLAVKTGRQQLKYDDQRLISCTNWNNVSSAHDLLLFKFTKQKSRLHVGAAYNNEKEVLFESNYSLNYYKTLNYIWLSEKVSEQVEVSAITIADGNQKNASDEIIYLRNTSGANLCIESASKQCKSTISGYYQFGSDKAGNEISAYFYSILFHYKFLDQVSVNIGGDYFSGKNALDTLDKKNRSFSNLYGSGHRFLGSMDFFTKVDEHTHYAGLKDFFVKMDYSRDKGINAQIAYHYFASAKKLVDPDAAEFKVLDRYLGSEIDCKLDFKLHKKAIMELAYSTMFANKTMEILKIGDASKSSHWIYCMLLYNF